MAVHSGGHKLAIVYLTGARFINTLKRLNELLNFAVVEIESLSQSIYRLWIPVIDLTIPGLIQNFELLRYAFQLIRLDLYSADIGAHRLLKLVHLQEPLHIADSSHDSGPSNLIRCLPVL